MVPKCSFISVWLGPMKGNVGSTPLWWAEWSPTIPEPMSLAVVLFVVVIIVAVVIVVVVAVVHAVVVVAVVFST